MFIDAAKLMYGLFQNCRHGGRHTGEAINDLSEVVELVKQQKTLAIEVSDSCAQQRSLERYAIPAREKHPTNNMLSESNQQLFSLVCIGIPELKRLWATESFDAVRMLGYAFHNVPRLFGTPDEFEPSSFWGNMTGKWDEYSIEMRHAICEMMHVTLQEAENMVSSVKSSSKNE